MIDVLPDTILPVKIICAPFFRFSFHRVVAAFLQTMHRHNVGRTCLRAAQPPLCAIPKSERRMNIDHVVPGSLFPHIVSNCSCELDSTKTVWPLLLGQQVFKKQRLHAVTQIAQFLCQVVYNARHTGFSLPRRSRYHQNVHLSVASLL